MAKENKRNKNHDAKGRFAPGNTLSKGRPKGSGKRKVQDLCWEQINRLAEMFFKMSNKQLEAYVDFHKDKLTRAEMAYYNASHDVKTLEALLDRIIGRQLNIDAEVTARDPIIERLYELPPGGVSQEIDQLLEARKITDAEYKDVTPPKEED